MGTKADKINHKRVEGNILKKNKMRKMDRKIYNLIEACHSSQKIEWKSIYSDNEEFRTVQKKKMADNQAPSLDDLMKLAKIPDEITQDWMLASQDK
jgi:hypothetical protein